MTSLKNKLDELRAGFPQFLRENDDLYRGKVVSYREVKSDSLEYYFLRLDHNLNMAMGIMFHGTSRSSIASICQNGMNDFSYYTNSLHYAMHHSEVSKDQSSSKYIEVLAMAVIVEESDRLGRKEAKLRHPTNEYSLPLYIITVKKD